MIRMKQTEFIVSLGLSALFLIPAMFVLGQGTLDFSDGIEKSIAIGSDIDNSNQQVLGVAENKELDKIVNRNSAVCPEDLPVIGWIDYNGNYLIVESLESNQRASKCFASIQEAQDQGWVLESNK